LLSISGKKIYRCKLKKTSAVQQMSIAFATNDGNYNYVEIHNEIFS